MKRIAIIFYLFISFILLNGQHFNPNSSFFENFGLISDTHHNYGHFFEIEVIEDLAYVGTNIGLLIYDVSDINNYLLIGFHKTNSIRAIQIVDDKIYLASKINWNYGLIEILNISDPSNPDLLFSYELQSYDIPNEINVKNNIVFICFSHLTVIDVNDYSNPIIIDYPSISMNEMVIDEDLMYASGSNMRIFDITDINNINQISSVYAPGMDIELINNYIYTTGSSLKTIDVSDPNNPDLVKQTFFTNNVSQQIEIIDETIFVSGVVNDDGLFAVLNISNPEEPEILVEYNGYLGRYLCVTDSNAYLCTRAYNGVGPEGLKTIDIQDYYNVSLSNFTISSTTTKCRAYDDLVFLANGYSGYKIIDISNIWNPNTISEINTKWRAVDIFKDLNILYVAEADSGIQIFNIEDSSNPVLLSEHYTYNGWDGYMKLDKYQDYLYTAGLSGINDIIDVSDPENPILVGSVPTNDWGPDIQIVNDHLFLAGYWGGFQIFSLEDPVNPVEVGYYPLGLALKIAVSNDLAYIYDNEDILIFDISNYNNPQLLTTYNPGEYVSVYDWLANGDTLYFSSSLSQLNILDVSNPNNPIIIDTVVNSRVLSFDIVENNFITHDEHYLRIFGDTTITSTSNKLILKRNNYLHQNFPNPCSESTNFNIYLPGECSATLEILNPNGQIVKTVFDCKLNKGIHNFICNLQELSPGLYFSVLTINSNLTETNKMILIK